MQIFTSRDLHLYYLFFWFLSLLTAIIETLITVDKEEEERVFCKNEDEPEMVAHTCNLGSRESRDRRITTSMRSAWTGMMFCTLFKTTLSQLKLLQLYGLTPECCGSVRAGIWKLTIYLIKITNCS